MIEAKLFQTLRDDATLSSLVGDKIFPIIAPIETVEPYISYFVVHGGDEKICLKGESHSRKTLFQVDVWSKSYKEAKEITEAIRGAVKLLRAKRFSTKDDMDEKTRTYRQIIEFYIQGE